MSDRLSEIEGRLAAATPDRWVVGYDGGWIVETDAVIIADMTDGESEQGSSDAELIAHAPADLAALVAVVKAVRALHVDDGQGWCDGCDRFINTCPTLAALNVLEES